MSEEPEQTEVEVPVILPTSDDPPVPVEPAILEWEAEHIPPPEPE